MLSRAAVLFETGAPLEIREIEVDAPKQEEVRVRVVASGLCHSDMTLMAGKLPHPLPLIPGHEAAGIVESVGPGVTSVAPGDHVLIVYRGHCGRCRYCAMGRPVLCQLGARIRATGTLADGTVRYHVDGRDVFHFTGVSGFSEHVVVPASAAIKVDPALPLDVVAVVGCSVLTGVGSALNAAGVSAGDAVVVIGCGGVGLNVLQASRLAGAHPIVGVDVSPQKLEAARGFGATHVLDGARDDVAEQVRALTGGDGADFAFDAVGRPALVDVALDALRPGGAVVVIGVPDATEKIEVGQLMLLAQEKQLRGSLYGSSNFGVDVPRILTLWQAGKLDLEGLIGRRIVLDQINEGFEALHHGESGRTVIQMG
ncbi:Zn-dependent alcohol dehydrogenase [Conexibacter sp. CPCC 206217]|uniref:Zn-dependent alcohol dehydrogenase n=1 Tax=Conexibacter sp. CPCC 206217 TaxID=3064574 RepID=UPI0027182F9C|nr:Zn-dependent alcohol dehydrogenase [Conexibacter sp. CPCC 206217]MDO8211656.1 Zn-dependent alcohol dehydrogenase [Conexibacter sp. CPCC 206217]